MYISFFANTKNPRVLSKDLTWEEITEKLKVFDIRDDKDGALYAFVRFNPEHRADKNVLAISAIVFDFDKGNPEPSEWEIGFKGIGYFWHTTFSHTQDEPKLRLIIPLSRPVTPDEYYHIFDVLYAHLGNPTELDLSCRSLSRAYFAPSCPKNRESLRLTGSYEGSALPVEPMLKRESTPIKKSSDTTKGRNDRLKEIAAAMIGREEVFEDIVDELVKFDEGNHDKPLFTDYSEGYRTTATKGAAKFVANLHRSLNTKPIYRATQPPPIILDIQKPTAASLPDYIFNPPGLVGEVYHWILKTSIKPQKELALGAALTAVGTIQGRKVRTSTDLRTNLYAVSLIETGGGKEHPRRAVQRIFAAINKISRACVEEAASDTAILEAIAETPSQLLLLDELGKFLATARTGKSHLQGIPTLLLRLFSSANSVFAGRVYASRQNNRIIQHPNVSILGTSTPEAFFQALSSDSTTDGFLNRLLFLPSTTPDPETHYPTDFEPPSHILNAFQKWEDLPYGSGNLANLPTNPPEPRIIPFTPEALSYIQSQESALRIKRQSLQTSNLAGTYTRVADIAQRIALILSAPNPISLDNITYGYTLAMFSADYALSLAENHISDNLTESNLKKVKNILSKNQELTLNDLYSKTRFLTRQQRQDILNSLEVMGEIVQTKSLSNGRAVHIIRYQEKVR